MFIWMWSLTIILFREDKLKHHLLKGCVPSLPQSNGDLNNSHDSRDSRDSSDTVKDEQELEIDDDEDNKT